MQAQHCMNRQTRVLLRSRCGGPERTIPPHEPRRWGEFRRSSALRRPAWTPASAGRRPRSGLNTADRARSSHLGRAGFPARALERCRCPAALADLRVALVHDWLTGMRGGEKCLEVLCRAFPDATLYTLIHRRGSLSPAIESMDDPDRRRSSRIPGVFRHYRHLLPIMPLAARAWRLKRRRPGDQPEPLRGQGRRAAAGRSARLLLLHADAIRLAGRETYLESWSDRPCGGLSPGALLSRLRRWDRATAGRVTHFVAISETVRERIARVIAATAG